MKLCLNLYFALFFAFVLIQYSNGEVTNDYFEIRLSELLVPKNYSDGTLYLCQEYELPLDNSFNYDLIKFEALVENDPMVHHILLFACEQGDTIEPTKPHLCSSSRASQLCSNWIAQWSLGMPIVNNMVSNAGFKIGKSYFNKIQLQVHLHTITNDSNEYNNESSGFRVYYTKDLREYSVGNVQIGQEIIEILPISDESSAIGGCSSECTQMLLKKSDVSQIYLTRIYLHMHMLGFKAELFHIEKTFNDTKINQIINDTNYSYNRPGVYEFHKNPITIKPGDEIILKCYYNTKDGSRFRNQTINWGEGANAEMCYAFITYYPRLQTFNKCTQFGEKDSCLYHPL